MSLGQDQNVSDQAKGDHVSDHLPVSAKRGQRPASGVAHVLVLTPSTAVLWRREAPFAFGLTKKGHRRGQ
jgi:hypothetical protein